MPGSGCADTACGCWLERQSSSGGRASASQSGSAFDRSVHRCAPPRAADRSRPRRQTPACAARLRLFFENWCIVLAPLLDGLLVALPRASARLLAAEAQRFEDATDMRDVI